MTKQNINNEVTEEVKNATSAGNKKLIMVAAAIVVIVLLIVGVKYLYLDPKTNEANNNLSQGLAYMNEAKEIQMRAVSMLNIPDSLLTDSVKAQSDSINQQAVAIYNKALNGDGKYPGFLKMASSFNLAKAQAAICYFSIANYKEAIKLLEDYSQEGDKVLSIQYLKVLADAYVYDQQVDKAIETLKEASVLANNSVLSPAYLLEAGMLLENQGKKEEALAIYKEIKEKYPQSYLSMQNPYAAQIDKYIERVSK